MKTRALFVCLSTALFISNQAAWAASKDTSRVSSQGAFELRHPARQIRQAVLSSREVSGVIRRAVRGGQPLQMLNPFASAKYGSAGESVSVDPDNPGKVNGIKFAGISF
jgi:hypothetical protein